MQKLKAEGNKFLKFPRQQKKKKKTAFNSHPADMRTRLLIRVTSI